MAKYRCVIFDFDGTIGDTLDRALKFAIEYQRNRPYLNPITREEFRDRSMREVLSHVGLSLPRVPAFVLQLKRYLNQHASSIGIFPDMDRVLRRLREEGITLYVMSSNSKENILSVLDKYRLRGLFTEIVSNSNIFGKHLLLNKMLREFNLNKTQTIYVGDEIRDIEACRKVGLDMVAVSWG